MVKFASTESYISDILGNSSCMLLPQLFLLLENNLVQDLQQDQTQTIVCYNPALNVKKQTVEIVMPTIITPSASHEDMLV